MRLCGVHNYICSGLFDYVQSFNYKCVLSRELGLHILWKYARVMKFGISWQNVSIPVALQCLSFTLRVFKKSFVCLAVGHVLTGDCQEFDRLMETTSPFLFPFVLEYSLIAMGTLAVMYSAVDEAADEQANTLRRIQNLFRIPALSANYGAHCSHIATLC